MSVSLFNICTAKKVGVLPQVESKEAKGSTQHIRQATTAQGLCTSFQ